METIATGFTALFAVIFVLGFGFVVVAGTVGLAVGLFLLHKASKHRRVLYGAAAVGAGALAYRFAPNIAGSIVNTYGNVRDAIDQPNGQGEHAEDPRDRVRFN